MVRKGRADATFGDELYLTYHLQSPYNNELVLRRECGFNNELIFIVSGSADEHLLPILQKGIDSLEERERYFELASKEIENSNSDYKEICR